MAVDLSDELKKMVKISFRGNIVHLPMLPQIQDALFQMVRNAFEHGIESPQERVASGKESMGKIELVFLQRGDEYKIIVIDDGGGIDFADIERQAHSLGLLEGEADHTSLVRTLFAAEFSTKAVPGAGGGLNMVQQRIHALGGKISVYTQLHKETHFTLSIPARH